MDVKNTRTPYSGYYNRYPIGTAQIDGLGGLHDFGRRATQIVYR